MINLEYCYQCGTCTASCPVAGVNPKYSPRRLVLGFLREGKGGDGVWLCCDCQTCSLRCPQGVPVNELIVSLKNQMAGSGCYPAALRTRLSRLSQSGFLVPDSQGVVRWRQRLGLTPHLPQAPVAEINALLQGTVLGKVLQGVREDG